MPRSNFSQRATLYDSQASVQEKQAALLVSDTISLLERKPLKIADLGCGTGVIGRFLKENLKDFELNNCDISTNMLAVAQENLGCNGIHFNQTSIPADANYDLILSNFALQWYEELPTTLKKCKEKLTENGVLAITLPVEGSFETLRKSFKYAGAEDYLFTFPSIESVKEALPECKTLKEEVYEEELSFKSSVELFKSLHSLGAKQTDKRLSTSKFRKLIRYHDELSDGKIIVTYKILKLIVKRVQ